MGVINFEDVEPGMILGVDILNKSGLTLLRAGERITEKHLRILKMWGITEANIEGVEKEEIMGKAIAEIDPRVLEEVTTRAQESFRHTDRDHPFIKELLRLVTLRLVSDLSQGKG